MAFVVCIDQPVKCTNVAGIEYVINIFKELNQYRNERVRLYCLR